MKINLEYMVLGAALVLLGYVGGNYIGQSSLKSDIRKAGKIHVREDLQGVRSATLITKTTNYGHVTDETIATFYLDDRFYKFVDNPNKDYSPDKE